MTTKGYTAEEFVQTALDIGIIINKLQAAKK
jgi:hypothetical protein